MIITRYNLIVRLLSTDIKDPSSGFAHEYAEIIGNNQNITKALEVLKNYPDIINYEIIRRYENGQRVLIKIDLLLSQCPLFKVMHMFSKEKSFPIIERVKHDGSLEWSMDINHKRIIKRIVTKLKKMGIDEVNVRFKKEKELTSKSFYILKIAYERGYFDVRRKITLRRLSKELNIPVSTLDTILRRSIKKIMDEIVK
ncbi:MAG: helix-turn-helix domain-containing protein [Thermoprotei archaeon]|jgi:predicted DNA binding protein